MLRFISMVVFLGLASGMAGPSAHAADVVFDSPAKRAVAALKPLTGTPPPEVRGKITVISFFASWCPPCTDEFRQLNKLRDAFLPDRVTVMALNLFESYAPDPGGVRMKRFLSKTKPAFPVLGGMADDALAARFGDVARIPTVFVFDTTGRLVFSFVHEKDATKRHANFDEIAAAVRPLIDG